MFYLMILVSSSISEKKVPWILGEKIHISISLVSYTTSESEYVAILLFETASWFQGLTKFN